MSKDEKKVKKAAAVAVKPVEKKADVKTAVASRKEELKKKNAVKASDKTKTQSPPPPPFPKKVGEHQNPLMVNSRLKTAICMVIAHFFGGDGKKTAEAIRNSGALYKTASGSFDNLEPLKPGEWSGQGYARMACAKFKTYMEEAKNAPDIVAVLPFVGELCGKNKTAKEMIAKLKPVASKVSGERAEKAKTRLADARAKAEKKPAKADKTEKKAVKPEVKSEKKTDKKVEKKK